MDLLRLLSSLIGLHLPSKAKQERVKPSQGNVISFGLGLVNRKDNDAEDEAYKTCRDHPDGQSVIPCGMLS